MKEAPGPRWLPGRAFYAFKTDRLRFLTRLSREFGDVAGFRAGAERFLLLSHPDLIRELLVVQHANFAKGRALEKARDVLGQGLLTSEGDLHRRQRRLVQPAFHRQRVASYAADMVELAAREGDSWRDGDERDLHADLTRLTLRIVARSLLGSSVEGEESEIAAAFTETMEMFLFFTLPFADLLYRLPLPAVRRFHAARARLDAGVRRLIAARRAGPPAGDDLLSMLLATQDDQGDGGGMSDEQVRDEVMTLFLAGHETTANALTWTFYLVAQHADVEARLVAEVRDVVGDRLPTAEDVPRLKYVESVFAESMRLFPPVWGFGRRAIHECELGGCRVPARTIVMASQWVTHRDPRFHPDPERFDPARFSPEARAGRPHFAYFPFGGGPRLCIGEAFAWMEGVLLLATLLPRFAMNLRPGPPVTPLPLITLRPKHGLPVRLRSR